MPVKRVLVVDDSAVVRQVLTQIINSHPELEVMNVASDPFIAAKKIQQEIPDVITLDIEMPRMDGITFLRKVMSQYPIPVVVISSLTEKGTRTAIKALEYGAVDVVTKPDLYSEEAFQQSKQYLNEIILAASKARPEKLAQSKNVLPKSELSSFQHLGQKSLIKTTEKVVAIGASTGGTEAVKHILQEMPVNGPGIIIVQHMPELFTRSFAKRLNEICDITVKEAENNDPVLKGTALLAPGNKHMELRRSGARYYVELNDQPLVNRHRPSVDVLFKSMAAYAGANAIGIILTGMGYDGAEGLLEMKNQGAWTIAQDEESSVVFGMPNEAIKRNAVHEILPLKNISAEMLEKYIPKGIEEK